MIVVIDYGMGNLKSVGNALGKLDIPFIISSDIEEIRQAKGLILPGVGAFADAMKNIHSLIDIISEKVKAGCPLLGICLGMQMLFERSFEGKETKGLSFLKGDIKLLEPKEKVKIPHIGWNGLNYIDGSRVDESFVYYVHSYYADGIDNTDLIAYSEYGGINIPGLVKRGNVWGAQFHPEKSGDVGLKILSEFLEMII